MPELAERQLAEQPRNPRILGGSINLSRIVRQVS